MEVIDKEELKKYKEIIDKDFKRLIQLEKSWIKNLSHKIMGTCGHFTHEDRKKLRDELIRYLNTKTKSKTKNNLKWQKKK